jgi:hypothetical protein
VGGSQTLTGRPPTTILRTVKFSSGQPPAPVADEWAIQFARYIRLVANFSAANRTVQTLAPSINGQVPQIQTRFWLGGFTEVRLVARVFVSHPSIRLLCAFAHPTYDFTAAARLPDTYALIGDNFPDAGVTSPIVVPLSTPYAISEWVPIHENFLETEVQCAIYRRNVATSGSASFSVGACDIQVR